MLSSSWSKLPNELLLHIFNHVNESRGPTTTRNPGYLDHAKAPNSKDLSACQLVCKNWSKTAQQVLYSHVQLGRRAIGFCNTVKKHTPSSHVVGNMVRKISFLEGFKAGSNNASKIMESIVQHCPNIQEIHALFTDQSNLAIWFLLEDERNQIKRLAKFITLNKWALIDAAKYESLALKYQKTMTQLQIPAYAYTENRGFSQHRNLEQKLSLFPALQQLYMANFHYSDVVKLDQLIESCSPTVHELSFEELFTLHCKTRPPQGSIKPNKTIKKLTVLDGRISTATLYYLSVLKLKGLEELTCMCFADDDIEWWKHLANMSLSLKAYDLRISLSDQISAWGQVQECLQIAHKTVALVDCKASSRTLKLSCLGRRSVIVYGKPDISLAKTSSNSYCFEIDFDEGFNFNILDLVARLQFYSADQIQFKFESVVRELHESLAYRVGMYSDSDCYYDSDSSANQKDVFNAAMSAFVFVPSNEIKKALRATRNINTNRHWTILDGLVAMLDPSKEQTLHLKYMILFEEQRPPTGVVAQQVSSLSFSCSILDSTILPALSLKLPHIGRLEFDACSILMENPYNLQVFLPTTSIGTLKLVVRPLADGLSLFPDYDYFTCQLEIRELLEAVSPTGHYILKIETDAKTSVSKRQGSKIIDNNYHVMTRTRTKTTGTPTDFLIHIKCKKLGQFLLSDDPTLEQGFEIFEQ